MSERPEADKVNATDKPVTGGAVPGAGGGTAPPSHPTTAEKPGTGTTKPDDTIEPGKRDPKNYTWHGSGTYPDGYRMYRRPDGTITLTDPDGKFGEWDAASKQWLDQDTNAPLPAEWSHGHYPGTADMGQGASPAHPTGSDKPQS